ncbi:hypothetical protein [Amycolatopsis mediterranei]|uniref:hypothetical protein n=1 Tax=Amycolatopsis mediterranei TaxID=33910 RepID=UPI0002F1601D|nr:hypothetical protein [Amycolatopsis mediterranei]UZF69534.1 hypothetical protein ISP_002689 [Amycolatopsis mediterranei]
MLGIVRPDLPATRLLLTCSRPAGPVPAGPVDGRVVARRPTFVDTHLDTHPAGRRAVPEPAREAA